MFVFIVYNGWFVTVRALVRPGRYSIENITGEKVGTEPIHVSCRCKLTTYVLAYSTVIGNSRGVSVCPNIVML